MYPHRSPEIEEFLNRTTTVEFLKAARSFIDLLEDQQLSLINLIKSVHSSLSQLYKAANLLEQIPLQYSGPETSFDDQELFIDINAGLIAKLGEKAFYWHVIDPDYSIQDPEPMQGWLVDDFSDIYKDLKIEVNKIDMIGTDEAVEDALWQLKFGFQHHWGDHCIDALQYLHFYINKN